MPWYAQREGLPDTHKMWADPGSTLEATLRAIGYVDVPAPGEAPPELTDTELEANRNAAEARAAASKPRGGRRA
jgi:hypothetical protein